MSRKNQPIYPRFSKKPPFSVDAPGYEPVEGETIPRRNPKSAKVLQTTPEEGIATLFDILKRSSAKYGNAKAIGSRKVLNTHEEIKKIKKVIDGQEQTIDKKWTYFELSEYHYVSFVEYERLALQLGAGLRKLGMNPNDRLHIFAATSANWLGMSHGAVSQSLPIVTAYDTLGEDGLKHSMVQTHARAIFLDPHLLPNLIKPLKEATAIQYVVYNTDREVKQSDIDTLKAEHPHLTIVSFEELRKLGQDNPVDATPPKAEDLCCIMYTSGSTGTPKGVPLKHKNVVAAIAGVDVIIGSHLGPGDSMLTYLPLAHIIEYMFENAVLFWGGLMGYGTPKTLTDQSVRNCKGDIREFKPTILVGVPAVWESVKKGVVAKVNQGSPLVQNMFWGALRAKNFLMWAGLPGSGILDAIVFKKVKEATGGRLRICLNGGGPIAKDTLRFISMCITPMISGYGLTETCAMGALTDPEEWTDQALGDIPAAVEIKLVDFPDAGYYSKNNPPQGEIWIRGTPIMEGYYQNEEETAAALSPDGWFKTGDIGEFDKNGHLRLIDRKKNLVKTLNGEYIALEKLESIYRSATVVANICVYAAEDKVKPIAIIVPAEPALKKTAADVGSKETELESLVHDEKVQDAVLKELQDAGKKGGLAPFEIIQGVALVDEEWTAQNGLVTSAQKVNRRGILAKYKKDIDRAYSKNA
ncbi:MAG: ADP-ribosylation factor GTPase activating protein, ER-Golgi transport [Chaenotheca gracillima]|nr:MAG: ADP-ribosylation factor GTPase activating protein, ER-Golgi transport [Chaenotheca gracillima]